MQKRLKQESPGREEPLQSAVGGITNLTQRDQMVVVLQRDVMTLLDSNARLALQLQALGQDLQKVYRRFKTLEAKLSAQGPQAGLGASRSSDGVRQREQLVATMRKWGNDLQIAAAQLQGTV